MRRCSGSSSRPDRKAAVWAASASARLDTSCWVATRTGPLLVRTRLVAPRIWAADAVAATAASTSTATAASDHSR